MGLFEFIMVMLSIIVGLAISAHSGGSWRKR